MPVSGARRRRGAGVRRRVVTAATVVVVLLLAGVFALTDQLRHPESGDGRLASPDVVGDPRDEVECPDYDEAEAAAGQLTPPGRALVVSSDDLLDCPGSYDGRRVRLQGEAVGELLRRRRHAWVQLNDGAYSDPGDTLPNRPDYAGANSGIGARLPSDAADEIDVVGGPHRHGDVVAVEGRFHRALPGTAEAMSIDADHVEQLSSGGSIDDPLLGDRRLAAAALAVVAGIMVAGERLVARRR